METKIIESCDLILDQEFFEVFRNNMLLFEKELEIQITSFLCCKVDKASEEISLPKKRGRKKIRPLNPIKTEIMDKFWLRGFREFMKVNISSLRSKLTDLDFWNFFLGKAGNPGKKRKYLSYSKHYKEFLASNKSFCMVFIAWIMLYGPVKIPRKNFKGNWDLYFSYLCTDLIQPCKELVDASEVIEALKMLSSVYDQYIEYANEKIRLINNF